MEGTDSDCEGSILISLWGVGKCAYFFSCYGTRGQGPTGRGFLLGYGTGRVTRVLAKKFGYRDGWDG